MPHAHDDPNARAAREIGDALLPRLQKALREDIRQEFRADLDSLKRRQNDMHAELLKKADATDVQALKNRATAWGAISGAITAVIPMLLAKFTGGGPTAQH